MKDIKNYIIALLAGLLVLTLSMQSSNGATAKTYDALRLAEYVACLNLGNIQYPAVIQTQPAIKFISTYSAEIRLACRGSRPTNG